MNRVLGLLAWFRRPSAGAVMVLRAELGLADGIEADMEAEGCVR